MNPTVEDYRSLYEVRVEMESLAAYFAAERCDKSELELLETSIREMRYEMAMQNLKGLLRVNFHFHERIVRASKNPFLISMTLQLRGVNSFYRRAIIEGDPRIIENALRDHEDIFLAIRQKDPQLARECMRKHIEHDYQEFMRAIQY
ncbi:DNA-binding GntR family transcriptional regulator [Sporosarcina luteola]|nr:DNA-binding GntR family transcriptional regulator [Sporosarcina luteola]